MRYPASLLLALGLAVQARATAFAQETVTPPPPTFLETFETPVLPGGQDFSRGGISDRWIISRYHSAFSGPRSPYEWRGLIKVDSEDEANRQAFAIRYAKAGATTKTGALGTLQRGRRYTVRFEVSKEATETFSASEGKYAVELLAYPPSATDDNRKYVDRKPAGTAELASSLGEAPLEPETLSFEYLAPAGAFPEEGHDLAIRVRARWSSEGGYETGKHGGVLIDNVWLSSVADTSSDVVGSTGSETPASAPVVTTVVDLPPGRLLSLEHRYSTRLLTRSFHRNLNPQTMTFSAARTDSAAPVMFVSATLADPNPNATWAWNNRGGLMIEAQLDPASGEFRQTRMKEYPECSEMIGAQASADGSLVAALCRTPKGRNDFDFDLVENYYRSYGSNKLSVETAPDEMWLYEWVDGDIQGVPHKYVVSKSIGGTENGQFSLVFGEEDNSYGVALKVAQPGGHQSDSFVVVQRNVWPYAIDKVAEDGRGGRGWSNSCGDGHTTHNRLGFNPSTREYGVLCAADDHWPNANRINPHTGERYSFGSINFTRDHRGAAEHDNEKDPFMLVQQSEGRFKGGPGAILALEDGWIAPVVGIQANVNAGELDYYSDGERHHRIPSDPATQIGLVRFDSQGNTVGDVQFVVSAAPNYVSHPQLVPLDNGRLLLGYGVFRADGRTHPDYAQLHTGLIAPIEYWVMEVTPEGTPLTAPLRLEGRTWGELDEIIPLGKNRVGWASSNRESTVNGDQLILNVYTSRSGTATEDLICPLGKIIATAQVKALTAEGSFQSLGLRCVPAFADTHSPGEGEETRRSRYGHDESTDHPHLTHTHFSANDNALTAGATASLAQCEREEEQVKGLTLEYDFAVGAYTGVRPICTVYEATEHLVVGSSERRDPPGGGIQRQCDGAFDLWIQDIPASNRWIRLSESPMFKGVGQARVPNSARVNARREITRCLSKWLDGDNPGQLGHCNNDGVWRSGHSSLDGDGPSKDLESTLGPQTAFSSYVKERLQSRRVSICRNLPEARLNTKLFTYTFGRGDYYYHLGRVSSASRSYGGSGSCGGMDTRERTLDLSSFCGDFDDDSIPNDEEFPGCEHDPHPSCESLRREATRALNEINHGGASFYSGSEDVVTGYYRLLRDTGLTCLEMVEDLADLAGQAPEDFHHLCEGGRRDRFQCRRELSKYVESPFEYAQVMSCDDRAVVTGVVFDADLGTLHVTCEDVETGGRYARSAYPSSYDAASTYALPSTLPRDCSGPARGVSFESVEHRDAEGLSHHDLRTVSLKCRDDASSAEHTSWCPNHSVLSGIELIRSQPTPATEYARVGPICTRIEDLVPPNGELSTTVVDGFLAHPGLSEDDRRLLEQNRYLKRKSDEITDTPVDEEVDAAVTEKLNPLFQKLDASDLDDEKVNAVLDEIRAAANEIVTDWRGRYNGREEAFNARYSQLDAIIGVELEDRELPGYKLKLSRGGPVALLGPPPASQGGFSGSSRADKYADMTDANWRDARDPAPPSGMTLIRHVGLDYGNRGRSAERKPGQSQAMGEVTDSSVASKKVGTTVSANDFRSTTPGTVGVRRSSEWLHLVAASDGNNVNFFSDVPNAGSLGLPTRSFTNNPQNPKNLVGGSYGANTLMMALEGAARAAPKAEEFRKEVKAYTSKTNRRHDAEIVEYRIIHKATGRSRSYYIDTTASSFGMLADYADMERDARRFFEEDHAKLPAHAADDYRYLDEASVESFMSRYAGDPTDTRKMREAVATQRAYEALFADASSGSALATLLGTGPRPEFQLDPDLSQTAGWDPVAKAVVLRSEPGARTQFDDSGLLESRILLAFVYRSLEGDFQSLRDQARNGTLSREMFRDEMVKLEYRALSLHHSLAAGSVRDRLWDAQWTSVEEYKKDTQGSLSDTYGTEFDRLESEGSCGGGTGRRRDSVCTRRPITTRGGRDERPRHRGSAGFLFRGGEFAEDNLWFQRGDPKKVNAQLGEHAVFAAGWVAEAGTSTSGGRHSASVNIEVGGSLNVDAPYGVEVSVSDAGRLEGQATIKHEIAREDTDLGLQGHASAGVQGFLDAQRQFGDIDAEGKVGIGVGASADVDATLIFDHGIPGASVALGFDAGVTEGGELTIGSSTAAATIEGGVIEGFAAGGDVQLGIQEDGKFHIGFDVKLAFIGGFEAGLDLSLDPHALFGGRGRALLSLSKEDMEDHLTQVVLDHLGEEKFDLLAEGAETSIACAIEALGAEELRDAFSAVAPDAP